MTQVDIDMSGFAGVDSYSPDEQAEFRVGSNDVPAYWYSQANTPEGETVSGLFVPVYRQDFDNAVEAYNEDHSGKQEIRRVTILHDETNESGFKKAGQSNEKEYWQLPTPTIGEKEPYSITLVVICKGLKSPLHERGIVSAWGEKGTVVRFRAFLVELAEYGFCEPICISTGGLGKAKMGFMDGVLYNHARVFTAFKAITGKKDAVLPYYSFSIPLGKTKLVSVGKQHTKGMILPVALIPQEITKDYLTRYWVNNSTVGTMITDEVRRLLPETVEWATQTFNEIDTSSGKASNVPTVSNDVPPDDDSPMVDEWGNEIEARPVVATKGNGGIATLDQRKALRRFGLNDLAEKVNLTYAEAAQAILQAQKK